MSLSETDQERYSRLAALEEHPGGTSSDGDSQTGEAASAIGRQMLLEALGGEQAVKIALRGGRPNLSGSVGSGAASPTIRVRVTPVLRRDLETLRIRLKAPNTSAIVRDALEEYLRRHLHDEHNAPAEGAPPHSAPDSANNRHARA